MMERKKDCLCKLMKEREIDVDRLMKEQVM